MIQTDLTFFSTARSIPDSSRMPTLVAQLLGADQVVAASGASAAEADSPPTELDGPCIDGDLFDLVGRHMMSIDEAAGLISDEQTVLLLFADWRRSPPLIAAMERMIASEVRGKYMPGEIHMMIGPHYVCPRSGPLMQDVVPTRTCCSVSISGYGSPSHWPKYQESLLKVPEFLDIQTNLSAIIPQLRFGMVFVP